MGSVGWFTVREKNANNASWASDKPSAPEEGAQLAAQGSGEEDCSVGTHCFGVIQSSRMLWLGFVDASNLIEVRSREPRVSQCVARNVVPLRPQDAHNHFLATCT